MNEAKKIEIDVLWQQAMRDSIIDGEQFTRYHFAKLIAAEEREACAKLVDYWEARQGEHSDAIRARGKQ